MSRTAQFAAWTTLIALSMASPAFAQHCNKGIGYNPHHPSPIHHDHVVQRLVDTRHAYHDVHDTHVISRFASQYQGTYCERNGHCYYQPTTTAQLQEIRFGAFSHVDDLAARLEFLSNELCLDLYYNYSHNPGFDATYAEAYEIFQAARFIHSLEHNFQDREAIRSRLAGLDALFHHVEGDVRGWTRHHHRQIGDLGIITKLDLMEASLHHLMNDVGVQAGATVEIAPPPVGVEVAPAPAVSFRR